jgi:CubicO group peptidase (beta-lactamase class C family)
MTTRLARLAAAAPVFAGFFASVAAPPAPPSDPSLPIEQTIDLGVLMKAYDVPGVSVAVVREFRILWAKGYGVTEVGGHEPVTPTTLFLAGSISKPVAAVGALALVDAGRLSLDQDVSKTLTSWRVPASGYSQPVTLARLLDHTAGFTGGDFYPGYAMGQTLPTLVQVLNGEPPANNLRVRLGFEPGWRWQYSGDGYLVLQQLMVDAARRPFAELMRELVFEKLDLSRTTFEQPLSSGLAPSAAAGTRFDGTPVEGRWHVSPELAAAGLWSTPTDLATLAIEIALSARGQSNRVLSRRMAEEMLSPHVTRGVLNILGTPEDPDRMGYGFFVGAKTHRFGHVGGHVGYQATLVMFADSGNGAVVMTNSDHGLLAGNKLLNAIARAYGWNYTAPRPPG